MNDRNHPPGKAWIYLLLLVVIAAGAVWISGHQTLLKKFRVRSADDPQVIRAIQSNQARVLVIGIDGLTWSILNEMISQNKLPNFHKLIKQGAAGVLHSEKPLISPALWTTYATGVPRREHKIDNFVFKPVRSYQTELMDSRVRQAPALWEILGHYGKKVAVVNWNSATPAEPISGVFIADGAKQNSLSAENVYPIDWIPPLQGLQPVSVDWFAQYFTRWNHPVPAQGYQSDTFITAAALKVLKREQPSLMMIYFRNIDVVSHLFWKYRFPAGEDSQFQVSAAERERFGDIIEKYYELMDELVGKLIEASPGYTVLIFSDHGEAASTPPENIFVDLNLLLHQLGRLEYQRPSCESFLERLGDEPSGSEQDRAKNIFFACEKLRHTKFADPAELAGFLIGQNFPGAEQAKGASGVIAGLSDSLSHPELAKEINWQKTEAFNTEDFHKNVRGIYINLKGRDPQGNLERENFCAYRKDLIKALRSLRNERGEKFFKRVEINPEKKEPVAKGIIDPPDVLVEFNPEVLGGQFIYGPKRDSGPFFISTVLWSYHDVSGDHQIEGVMIISGKDVAAGAKISATIYDPTPTILWLFDAPAGRDMPGKVLASAFPGLDRRIKYVADYRNRILIPVSWKAKGMSQEERDRLKAVGYLK